MWTFRQLETLAQDFRFALRVLRQNPGFTCVAVLSLALGIGANAAMFSFVSGVLLRPLPYPAPERLVRLTGSWPKGALVAAQELSRTLDVAGFSDGEEFNLTGQGEAVRLEGSTVSANFFAVLGARPELGRTFDAGDDRPGRDRIVVLSHALWQSRFGGERATLGRTIVVEGVEREVVGVMPPGFRFPRAAAQLWVPLRLDPGKSDDYWGFGWMPVVARLRAGTTLAQASQELRPMIGQIAALLPLAVPDVERRRRGASAAGEPGARRAAPAARAAGRGRDRASDRVRERGEPAALARGVPAQGDRAAGGTRRQPRPHPAPAADRERGALAAGRPAGRGARRGSPCAA